MAISKEQEQEIKAYNAVRDAMLLKRDVDVFMAFKTERGIPLCSSREVDEISMHKAITAVSTLPMEFRRESKAWLEVRGFRSMDDGDV